MTAPNQRPLRFVSGRQGLSLVEILVVVSIIALLSAILLPVISLVRSTANSAVCLSNLRQMGLAVTLYAGDNRGMIPPTQYGRVEYIQGMAYWGLWFGFIHEYIPPQESAMVWHCPKSLFSSAEVREMNPAAQSVSSYGMNEQPWKYLGADNGRHSLSLIPRHSEVFLLGDRWGTRDGIDVKIQGQVAAPYTLRVMTGPRNQPQQPGLQWEEGSIRVNHSSGSGTDVTNGRFNALMLDGRTVNMRWQDAYTKGSRRGAVKAPDGWYAIF